MKIESLFCIHCGEKHNGDMTPAAEPLPCHACEKQPVDIATLMLALDIMDLTLKLCSGCKRTSPMANKFCYHCGVEN